MFQENDKEFNYTEKRKMFCNWKNSVLDNKTVKYDTAILISRGHLCRSFDKHKNCIGKAKGVAKGGALCTKNYNYILISDFGKDSIDSITHEIAHT